MSHIFQRFKKNFCHVLNVFYTYGQTDLIAFNNSILGQLKAGLQLHYGLSIATLVLSSFALLLGQTLLQRQLLST